MLVSSLPAWKAGRFTVSPTLLGDATSALFFLCLTAATGRRLRADRFEVLEVVPVAVPVWPCRLTT